MVTRNAVLLRLGALAAVALLGVFSCARGAKRPGILLISIDSLRADHLGCYGYGAATSPRLDRLAREGTYFRTVVSTTSWTLPAHMSMLTGLLPEAHGVQKMSQRLKRSRPCVAEILRDAGFRTGAIVSSPLLDKTFGFDRGFETYTNLASLSPASGAIVGVDPSHEDTTGARVVEEAASWLGAHGKEPFFLFVHLWEPHYDYVPPPPFDTLFAGPPPRPNIPMKGFFENDSIRPGMDPAALRYVISQYDGEIGYSDRLVGRLLDELERLGLDRRTLVLVTSDHGEEFFEHGGKGHQRTLFDEVLLVPLIARGPGVASRPEGIAEQVSLIDLAPTILAAAGATPPRQMRGENLAELWGAGSGKAGGAGTGRGEHAPESSSTGVGAAAGAPLFEHAVSQLEGNGTTPQKRYCRWFSVRTPAWKSIQDCTDSLAVYDLRSDPSEMAPRVATGDDTSAVVRDAIAIRDAVRLHASLFPRNGAPPVPLDAEALERLRRLGYVD